MWAGEREFSLLVPVSLSRFKIPGVGFRASGASQPLEHCRHICKLRLPNRPQGTITVYHLSGRVKHSCKTSQAGVARRKLLKFQEENQEMSHLPNRNMHLIVFLQAFRMRKFMKSNVKQSKATPICPFISSLTNFLFCLLFEAFFKSLGWTKSLSLHYSHSFSHLASFQSLCIIQYFKDFLLVTNFSLQRELKSPNLREEEFCCDEWVKNKNWTKVSGVKQLVGGAKRFRAFAPAWSVQSRQKDSPSSHAF